MSIHKTYAVFGLGRYGLAVAKELVANGAEVLAVDTNADVVAMAAEELPICKCADITDAEVIRQLGVSNIDVVIIAMAGNLEASVMVITLCKEAGIHTCLDTSGCLWNEDVEALLEVTDLVLLDIKYTNEEDYRRYVGCSMEQPLRFLAELNKRHIPTTLRQVIIPSLNDDEENIRALKEIAKSAPCVDKIELLPFRKMCQIKYDTLGIAFSFGNLPEPPPETVKRLECILTE